MSSALWLVTTASACGARVEGSVVEVHGEEREAIERDLEWLLKMGHLAGFRVSPASQPVNASDFRAQLTTQFGHLVMDAIRGCPIRHPEHHPAFLVPVWEFEEDERGVLATTARFMNTEAELWAVPSCDDEIGFPVPGRTGLFLPLIAPYPNWRASSAI